MTIASPTLAEALAAELDPVDPHNAELRIAAALAPVAKWVHSFKGRCDIGASVSGASAFVSFLIWAHDPNQARYSYHLSVALIVVSVLSVLLPQFLWRRLYRGSVSGWYPAVFAKSELAPIKSFISRCANGEVKVKDDTNARVDKDFFQNILSILLLCDPERDRMLVKADLPRRCYSRQLRVESINGSAVRVNHPTPDIHQNIASAENVTTNDMPLVVEQISQVVEEEPERTNFSESDDWIAGGTLTQFEEGLGGVDKRDSQTASFLIQDCFLESGHGSWGFIGRRMGIGRASFAVRAGAMGAAFGR